MLGSRLARLRLRLDALQGAPSQPEGLRGWWLGLTAPAEVDLSLPTVTALDRALERVGVHTLADARLLLELGVRKGRVGELATGLKTRAQESLEEFERTLDAVEKMLRAGRTPPGARTALERGFVRLTRVLRVADLFLSPTPPSREEGGFEIFERPGPLWNDRGAPSTARMAVAEFLAQRARSNVEDLPQKRRDLDIAHEILLRIGMEHDRDRGVALRNEVAQARERVREQPATRSLDELVREVKRTASRDPQMAWRSLRGLYERALEANDARLAEAARAALEPMMPPREPLRAMLEFAERDDLTRWFGEAPPVLEGPQALRQVPTASTSDDLLADLAFSLRPEQLTTFELAAGCARYFDVEDALTEEVVEVNTRKVRPVPRRVPYPTQNMAFERTGGLHDVHNFVISDPRMLVYDLAAHSQMVRAYLEDEPPLPRPRKMKRTAVRVYVCDASGSMHGARARFRDAIIIAELNNLRVKARHGQPFDPLYFSFFNDAPTELARVDTSREATRQIEKLFRNSPAEGQTDISLALKSAFDSIRAAQGRDPYLARATVVLITDGEDRVDLELIRRTRAPMDALDISLSFISLGEENPDLKSLVMEQRARGGRAFYHHLSDQEIQWARTEFDSPWRTLLPREVPVTPEVVEALTPHLNALEALATGRMVPSAPVASEASFDALFPEPERIRAQKGVGEVPGPEVIARVADILNAIVEAAALAPADRRATEGLHLLQHLLGVYQLTPGRYLTALAVGGSAVHERLARVRLLCRPFE